VSLSNDATSRLYAKVHALTRHPESRTLFMFIHSVIHRTTRAPAMLIDSYKSSNRISESTNLIVFTIMRIPYDRLGDCKWCESLSVTLTMAAGPPYAIVTVYESSHVQNRVAKAARDGGSIRNEVVGSTRSAKRY
jgi:hypothetical protein